MGKQQQKHHFIIQRPASEAKQLHQQLTKALDTLGAYFTEIRRLNNKLTSQLSSSELNIGWWQARYTQEYRRLARASAQVEFLRMAYESLQMTYNSFLEDFRQLHQDDRNFRNNIVPKQIRHLEGKINHLWQNYDFLLEQLQERSRKYNFFYNLHFHY